MTTLTYTIEIDRPLKMVYGLAKQVERQPEFMRDYLSCKVLKRESGRWLLERTAEVRGKIVAWRSWVRFQENAGIHFVHEGGLLDGMRVSWTLAPQGPDRTRMTITQDFHLRFGLPWIGRALEKWFVSPKLGDIAQRVIRSFKRACEETQEVAS